MKRSTLILILLTVSSGLMAFVLNQWKVKKSTVTFEIKNLGVWVDGYFEDLVKANINFNPNNLESSNIQAEISVSKIKTGIDKRDQHLLASDYFDVQQYPKIKMVSTRFAPSKSGDFIGYFDLTIKGKTQNVKVPFKFYEAGEFQIFDGFFEINRLDFGVGGSSFSLSNEVKVKLKIATQLE